MVVSNSDGQVDGDVRTIDGLTVTLKNKITIERLMVTSETTFQTRVGVSNSDGQVGGHAKKLNNDREADGHV